MPLTDKDVLPSTPQISPSHAKSTINMNKKSRDKNDRDSDRKYCVDETRSVGSLDYDSFSTDAGSLDYDTFSSKGGDSLGYDDFSSVADSLEYNDFSSEDEESVGVGGEGRTGAGADGRVNGEDSTECGDDDKAHQEQLSAAYDVFDSGYGAFSDIIYEDMRQKMYNNDRNNDDHSDNSDTTSETYPLGSLESESHEASNKNATTDIAIKPLDNTTEPCRQPKPLSSGFLSDISHTINVVGLFELLYC